MSDQIDVQALLVRERIALATAAAMFVAGVLLVTVILPAEYGVDPVGTGRLLGLTQIAGASGTDAEASQAAAEDLEPVRPGANTPQSRSFRRNAMTFKLGPREGLEYKYRMEKGGSLVYSWKSTGVVKFDFHGEPVGAPKGYAESYEMGEKNAAAGSFFAPTSGIHGWYWENLGSDGITVTLEAAGFVASAIEFRATGRTDHAIPE
jgi:hypothetical protein